MRINHLYQNRRKAALSLIFAALVALATIYTPVVLDQVAGTSLTPAALACGGTQTGGGDC